MIVTLDLTRLLEEGRITEEEAERLRKLGTVSGSMLLFNILIGFGVVAVAAGVIFLVPDALTGVVIGTVLLAAGIGLQFAGARHWSLLSNICVLVGALVLAGGIVVLTEASQLAFVLIALGFAVVAAFARSGLLAALSILALASALGARTGYLHAMYFLGISEPTLTIVLFSALALATFLASKRLPPHYARLGIIAARTCVLLVNLGFWIGSLWGDNVEWANVSVPAIAYTIVWAAGLLILAVWAARGNRRWVVNVAAVFGAILFYTQWFETLGLQPWSVLIGGIGALVFAVGLREFNRRTAPAG